MHATIASLHLSYAETGRGPAVLLLHAEEDDRTVLAAHRPLLDDCGHRIVAVNPARNGAPPQALLELLNFLGLGRVLLIALAHGDLARSLQQRAPDRVVGLALLGEQLSLEEALKRARRDPCLRRPPLQRLNRRLGGLWQALLPPEECEGETLSEPH